MIKVALSILIAIIFLVPTTFADDPAPVEYKTGSKIAIVFGAQWCPPCRQLGRNIKNSDKIKAYVKADNGVDGVFVLKEENKTTDKVTDAWFKKAFKSGKPQLYPTSRVYEMDAKGIWQQKGQDMFGLVTDDGFIDFINKNK